jgi:hypothetical protein
VNLQRLADSLPLCPLSYDSSLHLGARSQQVAQKHRRRLPWDLNRISRSTAVGRRSFGQRPDVGDIAYYAPWGNLAIYYKDFGYSNGLIILGKIDSGPEAFDVPGSVKATIELVK